MGMSSDTNENVIEEPIVVEAKKEVSNENFKTIIGGIWLKGGFYQLAVDQNHRMYKAKKIGEHRDDLMNRSPLIPDFGPFEPITDEDYE